MYKDKGKQRVANRVSASKSRLKRVAIQKGMTQGVTGTEGMTQYPDILDKLTDPIWRGKLEKICHAFKSSNNPSYSKDVWLGDTNLSTACDWLECTSVR